MWRWLHYQSCRVHRRLCCWCHLHSGKVSKSDELTNQRLVTANVNLKTSKRNVTETKSNVSILVLAMPTVLKDGPSGHNNQPRQSTVPVKTRSAWTVQVGDSGDPCERLFYVFELDLLPRRLWSTASWWELQHLFIRIARYSWWMYFRLLQR